MPTGPASSSQVNLQAGLLPPMSLILVPVLTGFTYQVPDDANAVIFTEAGTIATGNIILPVNPYDEQRIQIGTQRTITTLTVLAGNSSQVLVNNPTTLTGGNGFTMIFNASNQTWYRLA